MRFTILLLMIGFTLGFGARASSSDTSSVHDISIGQRHTLTSTILGTERAIQIGLPESYDTSDRTYPVLYVLDGQWQFLYAVAYARRLHDVGGMPEVIVIGIPKTTPDELLFYTEHESSASFMAFMEKELIPYVDATFRTRPNRTITGWGHSGGFALAMMAQSPALFSHTIVSSPFPAEPMQFDAEGDNAHRARQTLYFGVGDNEEIVKTRTDALAKSLTEAAPDYLSWSYVHNDGEGHTTTPHKVLHAGLRYSFSDFKTLTFDAAGLASFNDFGGLDAIRAYYKQRANLYGVEAKVDDDTLFNLLRLAQEEDNLGVFNEVLEAFPQYTDRAVVYHVFRYGNFYAAHTQWQKAIAIYRSVAERAPKNAAVRIKLGDAYAAQDQKDKALSAYHEALERTDNPKMQADIQGKIAALP